MGVVLISDYAEPTFVSEIETVCGVECLCVSYDRYIKDCSAYLDNILVFDGDGDYYVSMLKTVTLNVPARRIPTMILYHYRDSAMKELYDVFPVGLSYVSFIPDNYHQIAERISVFLSYKSMFRKVDRRQIVRDVLHEEKVMESKAGYHILALILYEASLSDLSYFSGSIDMWYQFCQEKGVISGQVTYTAFLQRISNAVRTVPVDESEVESVWRMVLLRMQKIYKKVYDRIQLEMENQ